MEDLRTDKRQLQLSNTDLKALNKGLRAQLERCGQNISRIYIYYIYIYIYIYIIIIHFPLCSKRTDWHMSFTEFNLPRTSMSSRTSDASSQKFHAMRNDVTVAVDNGAGPLDAAEISTSASDTLAAALAVAKGFYLEDLAALEVRNQASDYMRQAPGPVLTVCAITHHHLKGPVVRRTAV